MVRTSEWINKISKAKLDELNPNWSGDNVKYAGVHGWVRRRKPKPEFCEICNIKKPIDLANISQKYFRDIKDFEWLCRKCHMTKDGRMKNLVQYEAKK